MEEPPYQIDPNLVPAPKQAALLLKATKKNNLHL